jgi:molybdopterin converting factor small subunit
VFQAAKRDNVPPEQMGQLRAAAGRAVEEVELPARATAGDLLRLLAERHAALKPLLVTPDGQVSRALLVVVGERQVRPGEPLNAREGETITLLPPIGGG